MSSSKETWFEVGQDPVEVPIDTSSVDEKIRRFKMLNPQNEALQMAEGLIATLSILEAFYNEHPELEIPQIFSDIQRTAQRLNIDRRNRRRAEENEAAWPIINTPNAAPVWSGTLSGTIGDGVPVGRPNLVPFPVTGGNIAAATDTGYYMTADSAAVSANDLSASIDNMTRTTAIPRGMITDDR